MWKATDFCTFEVLELLLLVWCCCYRRERKLLLLLLREKELPRYIHAELRSLNRFQSSPSLFFFFRSPLAAKKNKIKVAATTAIAAEQLSTTCCRDANCNVHRVPS
jgi:hypothetical protein